MMNCSTGISPPEPTDYKNKKEALAQNLCEFMKHPGGEGTPWNVIFEYEDKFDALNAEYKQEYPGSSIQLFVHDKCPTLVRSPYYTAV